MTLVSAWLALFSGISLIVAVVLFFSVSLKRRELDAALRRAASRNGATAVRQLGILEPWDPNEGARTNGPVGLVPPERRWTYDRDYVLAFIAAAAGQRQSDAPEKSWLSGYAGPILGRDIAFAAAFASFIALAWLAIAECIAPACLAIAKWPHLCLWTARIPLLFAAFGVVYGVADVAEDLKLRRIFQRAEAVRARRPGSADRNVGPDEELDGKEVDDAEVDAANALTRVKLVTITASLIGLVVFVLLQALESRLVKRAEHPPGGDRAVA